MPGERNAYFDSKVLSLTHAEIWEQGGKVSQPRLSRGHSLTQCEQIYIKDVKSSNGTFINGVRLSPEAVESEPFELKSEDMVVRNIIHRSRVCSQAHNVQEFGIDIISEDNRTIIHHKVSARAYCVFTPDDAALSAR